MQRTKIYMKIQETSTVKKMWYETVAHFHDIVSKFEVKGAPFSNKLVSIGAMMLTILSQIS
jgi:hypothetical protein